MKHSNNTYTAKKLMDTRRMIQGTSLLLLLLILFSCTKDLGNYTYKEVAKVDSVWGLLDTTVRYNAQLKINPTLKFNLSHSVDAAHFSYEWMYLSQIDQGDKILLSTAQNLDYVIRLKPGRYKIFYAIKSKTTGIEQRFSFMMQVINEISEGWLLLTDQNGTAGLDMLSLQYGKPEFEVIRNLLQRSNSALQLSGAPINIYGYVSGLLPNQGANFAYALYVHTADNGFRIEPDNFTWQSHYTLSKEVIGSQPGMHAEVMRRNGLHRVLMVSNGDIYLYDRAQQIRFSAPINRIVVKNQFFKAAPFIGSNETSNSAAAAIFFDETHRQFVKHTGTASGCTEIPDPYSGKLFSFKIGMDLRYMTRTSVNNGEVVSILYDKRTKRYFVAAFNPTTNAQHYFMEIKIPDFEQAKHLAISPNYGHLFYSMDSKIYAYDFLKQVNKLMIDYGPLKISSLKFHIFHNVQKYSQANDLIVCSYDETKPITEQGQLDSYRISLNMTPPVSLMRYTGFGKVQDLIYRER